MQKDNNYTDSKLQELENQSLPDLSKMDEHWQQMSPLLLPAAGSAVVKRSLFTKKTLFISLGVISLLIASFFIIQNVPDAGKKVSAPENVYHPVETSDTLPGRITASSGSALLSDTVLKTMTATTNNKLLLEKFYVQLQKKPQLFQINNQRDTTIYGKEGTQLYIPAQSFDVQGSFTLLLTEFYSIDDMIAQKLTTTCDGHRLITGGMIFLDAINKDRESIDLKNGASLRLDVPRPDGQLRMELFYGEEYYRNDITTVIDSINWNRTNQVFTDDKTKPVKAFLTSNSGSRLSKIDTLWLDGEKEERTFDYYVAPDTISGNPGIKIKGDSIVLQKFGVNINRLGWINCDRFYNDARPKTELIVDLGDDPNNYNTMLVFDNFASILRPSSKQGNSVRFLNLPEGEAARIVTVGIRNNKPVTAMRKLIISKTAVGDLDFEETSPSSFRKQVKGFDK